VSERPIFIVSPPRAGIPYLFDALAKSPSVYTLPESIDAIIESIESLHPRAKGFESHRLTAEDATPTVIEELRRRGRRRPTEDQRLLACSTRAALRIPFLRAVFPDAQFVYIYREVRSQIGGMIDAWKSGQFIVDRETGDWSMLLVPGWRELRAKPLEEIAAHQQSIAMSILLDDLEKLPAGSWCVAKYDRLFTNRHHEIARICSFLGIESNKEMDIAPPREQGTIASEAIGEIAAATDARARALFADSGEAAFSSIATTNFASILQQLGVSLLVSTYQSGRLIAIRAESPTTINTHFRIFKSPMGIAVGHGRFALGTEREVWDYRDQPAVAAKIEPRGKHDACFLPRNTHFTGDIRIHEIGFANGGELWIVNTRFSALCTLDADNSFVPRWRPSFVTHLAPEDRCHLNGMAIIDDRVRYVTALGTTNEAGAWRANKASGGVLIDVDSGEIVLRGLSMPHSPRQYNGDFFVLESGKGTLARVDLASQRVDTIAQLPGFTRGLAFAGPFAFVGLSQVRESNIFGGIPLVERVAERKCGVWVIDLRTGQIAAFLQFEGIVQEIFDVQVLHGTSYPEILEATAHEVAVSFTLPDEALADVAR